MERQIAALAGKDPVEQLGRELGRAIEAGIRVDEKRPKHPALDTLYDQACRRRYQIEAAIPAHQATSIPGALVSLIRASQLANTIADQMPKIDDGELDREMKMWFRDLEATLYSAVAVLRDAAPGVFEACGGQFYMADYLDPFTVPDRIDDELKELSAILEHAA